MGRNFLVFLIGLVLLLVFSFAFCAAAIYAEQLAAGILALVGFVAVIVMALLIGLAAREESAGLSTWFFAVAGFTAVLLIWFITRSGTLLQVW